MSDSNPDNRRLAGNANTKRKYAYKQLPQFNPTFYHSWAMDVELAFAERDWTKYLHSPTDQITHDPAITIQATAFLSQSIPYERKSAIRQYNSARSMMHSRTAICIEIARRQSKTRSLTSRSKKIKL